MSTPTDRQTYRPLESVLTRNGLRYWEYDIPAHRLYRSQLVQDEIGFSAYKENVPESYVEEGVIHPDYAQKYLDFYHALQRGENGRLVFRSMLESGEWGWLDISYEVICDGDGRPIRAIGAGGPVSSPEEQVDFFKTMQQQQHILELLLKSAATYEFEFLTFVDGKTQKCLSFSSTLPENVQTFDNYSETLMYEATHLPYEDPQKLQREISWEAISSALERNGAYSVSASIRTPDGGLRRKLYSFYYIDREKKYILGSAKDVTEIYNAEQEYVGKLHKAMLAAEAASLAKSNFLSNLSHDIRTPMNAILNLTNLALEDMDDSSRLRSDLDKIKLSGGFLLGLINDILDMSRIESGRMKLTPKVYTARRFENYLESVMKPLFAAKNIRFAADLRNGVPALYVDELRFNQIFFNILSNAAKYTPEDGLVTLTMRFSPIGDGRQRGEFKITDNGIGMSEEFVKKAFEPFERESSDGSCAGTGLGLSITNSVVRAFGGEIGIESAKGKGTSVSITMDLPVPTKEQLAKAALSEKLQKLHDIGSGMEGRVLIAEDHPLNREVIVRLLKKLNIEATCVENGEKALETLRASEPGYYQMVLMDLRMPVMDGITATRAIRTLDDKRLAAIPIAALTADAFNEDMERCMSAGMDAFLSKPVNINELSGVLQKMLGGGHRRHSKILLVDDSVVNVAILEELLKDDFEILTAADGTTALELLEKTENIAAVITDLQMPLMDGMELISRIRANCLFDKVAIIANTQYGAPEQEERLLLLGADDFVYKPFSPALVISRLYNVLKKYRDK